MSQPELLTFALNQLERLAIPYMVTGSTVSSIQREPRLTHDIDFVIILESVSIPGLIEAFSGHSFYLNPASIQDAIDQRRMFNVIDSSSGNKLDFWMLTDTEFDKSRFARRQRINALGLDNFIATTPEGAILSKLRWANEAGGSEKQLTDAVQVFEMQFDLLDITYLKTWVEELMLQQEWHQLVSRAEPY